MSFRRRAPSSTFVLTLRSLLVLLVVAGVTPARADTTPAHADVTPPRADTDASPTTCQPGRFESVSEDLRPDGSVVQSRSWTLRHCLGDGLEMDEFFALDRAGRTVFRGVSFTAWNATRTGSRTWWVMVGDPGWTTFTTVVDGNQGFALGGGFDAGGSFLERSVTTWRPDGTVHFAMDRSFDAGRHWAVPFARITMQRVDDDEPSRPEDFVPMVRRALDEHARRDDFAPILDGHAALALDEDEAGDRVVVFGSVVGVGPSGTVRSDARAADDGPVWRELSWSARTGYLLERHRSDGGH